jgi:hypothetical protein
MTDAEALLLLFAADPTARHCTRQIDDRTQEIACRTDDGVLVVSRVINEPDGAQRVEPIEIFELDGTPMRRAPEPIPTSTEIAKHATHLIVEAMTKLDTGGALQKADGNAALQKVFDDAIGAAISKAMEPAIASLEARVDRLMKSD